MRWLIPLLALVAGPAAAHAGHDHGPGWTLSPTVALPLALTASLYAIGWTRLRRRSDRGRKRLSRNGLLFAAGWLALSGALVTPLHEAGERSFALHMIEHELIMLLAALLLVAARPGPVLLWAFPGMIRRALAGTARWPFWQALGNPLLATALQAVVMIVWHLPALFDLALRHEGWHVAQHLSFILSALLFWWSMLHGRGGPFVAALCLFATSMIGGGLGALMALASSPWYPAYAALGLTPEGFSPVEDQQLAGLIMWVPGGLWHLAAALLFLARGLRASAPPGLDHRPAEREQAAQQDEQADPNLPAPAASAHP
jgi:cytochrome c oxidase assembly factor CtaG